MGAAVFLAVALVAAGCEGVTVNQIFDKVSAELLL